VSLSESNESKLHTATVLRTIAKDMREDAEAFDGQPFSGRTVAEYMGNHGAAIAAIAEILADELYKPCGHCGEAPRMGGAASEPPERDPVPYLDYLPEPERTIFSHCNWVGGCETELSEQDGSLLCAFHRAPDGWVA